MIRIYIFRLENGDRIATKCTEKEFGRTYQAKVKPYLEVRGTCWKNYWPTYDPDPSNIKEWLD